MVGAWQTYGADTEAALEGLLAPTTDFTKLEQGEQAPGGGATSRGSTYTANAFSLSSGNMDFKRELDFKIGNAIFRKTWISAPSSTDASDGLGPLFNSRACQNCHLKDGRGHPPFSADVPDDSGSMLVRLSVPAATEEEKDRIAAHSVNSIPEPTYGGQLQDRSIQGFAAEGKLDIDYTERKVTLADGEVVTLRVPSYSLADLAYGPMSPDLMISPRVAPPMIGLGLLEAVPEEQILANADPDDANKDGISGKAEPCLVARARQGDARPLRLEGGGADHRPAGGRGVCRRYRAFDHHDAVPVGRLHRARRRPVSMRRTATRRNIRTSRSATSCSSS